MRAIALTALLLGGGAARAQAPRTTELLRPLAVDLRRLYPDLADRWDLADESRYRRTPGGFEAERPFLAAEAAPLAALPERATGTFAVRRGFVRVEQELLGARPAAARAEAGLIRYRGAFAHTEALYVAGDSFEPSFLLRDAGAPTRFRSRLRVRGGRLGVSRAGNLTVYDGRGAAALSLGRPVARDAGGRSRLGRWTLRGGRAGEYTVTLTFDPSGLAYPVLLD